MNNNLTFETRVEMRQAFAARRRELLANWVEAFESRVPFSMTHWAARIASCNDTELALLGGTR